MNYFNEKYGTVTGLTLVPYLRGRGSISQSDGPQVSCFWEVIQLADGHHEIHILTDNMFHANRNPGGLFPEISLNGSDDSGSFRISSNSIVVFQVQNFQSFTCSSRDDLTILHNKKSAKILKFHILNFAPEQVLNRIKFRNRTFKISKQENIEKIKSALNGRRLSKASMYIFETDLKEDDSIEKCKRDVDDLCWMLSLLALQSVFVVLTESFDTDGSSNGYIISTANGYEYFNSNLLGIRTSSYQDFIKQTLNNFNNFLEKGLRKAIHWTTKSAQNDYVEIKWALLILAFEYVLTFFLSAVENHDLADIKNWNIQNKMKRVNNTLRFIPAKYLNDNLREGVRNPLFHTGEITNQDSSQLYSMHLDFFRPTAPHYF